MSELTTTKVISSDEPLSDDTVIAKIEEALKKEFNKVKIKTGKTGDREFSCRVKTKLFNPIVSIKGKINIQTKENKAKVMIDADTKTNFWFWFSIIFDLFFWPGFLITFYMHSSQKKSSIKSLGKVFDRMEYDLGSF